MARTETEQLVFSVEARIAALEKQMSRAGKITDEAFTGMERRSKRAAAELERNMASSAARVGQVMKSFGQGLLAGATAGGLIGLVDQVRQVAKGMASIGDEARRAGLSTRTFQELGHVARQNRIGVDQMADGIRELNIRADEWITTGGGPAADAFRRLGFTSDELRDKLRDPSRLFSEIIGKLGQLDSAAQIRIADEIFGGGAGEKFVQLIGQGEQGIRDTIQAAHDLGGVIDESLIRKAEELDRKFDAVATTVGTALKTAIVEAASSLQSFIESFWQFQDRSTTVLEGRLSELMTRRGQLQKQAGSLEDRALALIGKDAATELKAIDDEMARIAGELRKRALPRLREELLKNVPAGPTGTSGKGDRLSNLPSSTDVVPTARPEPYFADAAASAGEAAQSFGRLTETVDRFVANLIKAESGGDRFAKNPNSSATGVGQFIDSTWLDLIKRYFDTAGQTDSKLLDLRADVEVSTALIKAYATENAEYLRKFGIAVDEAALHLAHFLGPQGAAAVLSAPKGTPVSQVLSADAIAANPTILGGGATVDSVIAYAEARAGADALASSNANLAASYGTVTVAADGTRMATQQVQQAQEALGQIATTVFQGLASALQDGKIEASELLGILAQVIQQLLSMPTAGGGTLLGSIVGAFVGGFGGGGVPAGGVTAGGVGLWHTGGVVGQASAHRHGVHPGMFLGAPRFHGGGFPGLRPGEVPAILQRGEVVLPRGYRSGRDEGYGGVTLNYAPNIDARGADAAAVARIERSQMKEAASLKSKVITIFREARRDRMLKDG